MYFTVNFTLYDTAIHLHRCLERTTFRVSPLIILVQLSC